MSTPFFKVFKNVVENAKDVKSYVNKNVKKTFYIHAVTQSTSHNSLRISFSAAKDIDKILPMQPP